MPRSKGRLKPPASSDPVVLADYYRRLPKGELELRSRVRQVINLRVAQDYPGRKLRVQFLQDYADSAEELAFLKHTGRLPELDAELDRATWEAEDKLRAAKTLKPGYWLESSGVSLGEGQLLHPPYDVQSRCCWVPAISAVTGVREEAINQAFDEVFQAAETLGLPAPPGPPVGLFYYWLPPLLYRLTGLDFPLRRVQTANTFLGETSLSFAKKAADGIYLVGGYEHVWALAIQNGSIAESAANDIAQFDSSHPDCGKRWWSGCYPVDYPPITFYQFVGGNHPLKTRRAAWGFVYGQPVPLWFCLHEAAKEITHWSI